MAKDIPFYRQLDAMQCGVACLAMVCASHGRRVSISHLEKLCAPSVQGVSAKAIRDASQSLGFECIVIKAEVKQLAELTSPIILHWNQNHFVVLYRIDRNCSRFWIADPSKGKYRLNYTEFCQHWISTKSQGKDKGITIVLNPTKEFYLQREQKESSKRSFRFLWGYIMQYRRHFAQIVAGLLLGCILQLIMPFLTQWIVDIGIKHHDINLIWLILLGEMVIIAGRTITDIVRRRLLLHISMRINISLVSDFFIKLLRLPMSFFDTKLMGDLLQRMEDHRRVQSFLTSQFLSIMFTILSFLIFGVVLAFYNLGIFVVFLTGSIIYALWIARFLQRRKVIDNELFEQQALNRNFTYQFITSIQEIKLQNCERRRRWEWEDKQADLFEVQMRSLRLEQSQQAGSIFINEIKNIIITVMAATAVINGHLSLGAMLAIQYIVGQLNSPVEQFMQFIYSVQDVKISLERINEIHENDDEITSANSQQELKNERSITLDNVSFRYNQHAAQNTISNVSFNIPAEKVTAIVGASGSGKTTLIKLLLGYYPVNNGHINISGDNILHYDLQWWRQQCGVVMQEGVIFSESIARNIAVDDNDIDKQRLIEAARIACIHDYIMTLPLKYDTKIGRDGVGISQGQKQRILIARAVYRNPKFIFLDEATNSLDAKNERAIVENLAEFCDGRTVVIVAHRLSTVQHADQIVVLDKGNVVEIGTHENLIGAKGTYYSLVKNQLELGN